MHMTAYKNNGVTRTSNSYNNTKYIANLFKNNLEDY